MEQNEKLLAGGGEPCPELVARIFSQRTFIMGVAMISIMLFHQHFVSAAILRPFTYLGHLGVDVFFFVSGMGIASSLERNRLSGFYLNRALRLFPAWILVMAVTYLFPVEGRELTLRGFVSWFFHLWFLKTLLIFYILSPVLRMIVSRWRGAGVLLTIVLCFVFLYFRYCAPEGWTIDIPPSWRLLVDWSLFRLPAYMVGLHMIVWKPRVDIAGPGFLSLTAILLLCVVLLRVLVVGDVLGIGWSVGARRFADAYSYFILAPALPGLCGVVACCGAHLSKTRLSALIGIFGALSLELYLWHEWLYSRIGFYMETYDLNGWLCLVAAFAFSIALAWGTHWLCAKGLAWLKPRKA